MTNIHILEDNQELREYLITQMSELRKTVTSSSSIEEFEKLNLDEVSLFVLDRIIGEVDIADQLTKITQKYPTSSILILSAINSAKEKARCINLGADDYLGKPFSTEELLARANALLRSPKTLVSHYEYAGIVFDIESFSASIKGKNLNLSPKEFSLLMSLAKNPGKILSREYLLINVWKNSPDLQTNIVETTINSVRKKLSNIGTTHQIKNTRFVGYWLES